MGRHCRGQKMGYMLSHFDQSMFTKWVGRSATWMLTSTECHNEDINLLLERALTTIE